MHKTDLDLDSFAGRRCGPYNSFNPVSRVQIWQWCSAMGDRNPLYRDDNYRIAAGFARPVAPPAMMQMWTMRDVNMELAPGSTDEPAYAILDALAQRGYPGNVAVSYDLAFHKMLQEGDRPHYYTTIVNISDLKQTRLGAGHFVTEQVEYLDQDDDLFAEALITYFQYRPADSDAGAGHTANAADIPGADSTWKSDFSDRRIAELRTGDSLPALVIPITHKLIVSGAIATQDFIDVHHNAPAARAAAMPDIFMNILTTCGLSARYLSDWAGPGSRLQKLAFNLMAPNVPGDTMVFQGRIKALNDSGEWPSASVEFAGSNSRGVHVSGTATLELAG